MTSGTARRILQGTCRYSGARLKTVMLAFDVRLLIASGITAALTPLDHINRIERVGYILFRLRSEEIEPDESDMLLL